jgi:hypothetical protein
LKITVRTTYPWRQRALTIGLLCGKFPPCPKFENLIQGDERCFRIDFRLAISSWRRKLLATGWSFGSSKGPKRRWWESNLSTGCSWCRGRRIPGRFGMRSGPIAMLDEGVLGQFCAGGSDHDISARRRLGHVDQFSRAHSLAEVFSTLTGSRLGFRVDPADAAEVVDELAAALTFVELNIAEITTALREAKRLGVRGGRVHDFLHSVAANKAGCQLLRTLNTSGFEGLFSNEQLGLP